MTKVLEMFSPHKSFRLAAVLIAMVTIAPGLAWAGGFDRAIETATPRVVKLYGLGAGLQAGFGTGIVVSDDGLVLTVLSLLIDARNVRAVDADGTRYDAEVVYRDPPRQLALLRLRNPSDVPTNTTQEESSANKASIGPLPYFDLSCEPSGGKPCHTPLQPGDWVVAAGNAFKVADGPEPVSIAHGIFSTRTQLDARRRVKDFPYTGEVLVIDAITSNPGAPGSALVNLDGELIGMIGRLVISNQTHTHLNYAMPFDVLHAFWTDALAPSPRLYAGTSDVQEHKPVDLGIRISRTGYRTILPFVDHVRRHSPAARAGVRKDDLILSINGRNVADADAFDMRVKMLLPGKPAELVIRRGKLIRTIHIEAEAPR